MDDILLVAVVQCIADLINVLKQACINIRKSYLCGERFRKSLLQLQLFVKLPIQRKFQNQIDLLVVSKTIVNTQNVWMTENKFD